MLPSLLSLFGKRPAPPPFSLTTFRHESKPELNDPAAVRGAAAAAAAAAMVPVTRKLHWLRAQVEPGASCHFSGAIDLAGNDLRSVVGRVRFLDEAGRVIEASVPGLSRTEKLGDYFYPGTQREHAHRFGRAFSAPPNARHIEVALTLWRTGQIKGTPMASGQLCLAILSKRPWRLVLTNDPLSAAPAATLASILKFSEGVALPVSLEEAWLSAPVRMHGTYTVALRVTDTADASAECILLRLRFFNAAGALIPGRYEGLFYSEQAGAYRYLLRSQRGELVQESFSVPHGAVRLDLCLQRWRQDVGMPRVDAAILLYAHGARHVDTAEAAASQALDASPQIRSLIAREVRKALSDAVPTAASASASAAARPTQVAGKETRAAATSPSSASKTATATPAKAPAASGKAKPSAGKSAAAPAAKPPAAAKPTPAKAASPGTLARPAKTELVEVLQLPGGADGAAGVGLTNAGVDILPRVSHGVTYVLEGRFEKDPRAQAGFPALALFSFAEPPADTAQAKAATGLSHSAKLGYYKYLKPASAEDLSFSVVFKLPKPLVLEKVTLRKWHPDARPVLNRQVRLLRRAPANKTAAFSTLASPRLVTPASKLNRDRLGEHPLSLPDAATLAPPRKVYERDGFEAACQAIEASGKPARAIAADLVGLGQLLDPGGDAGAQFAFAERALHRHRSSPVLLNYFWAAVQAAKVPQAYAASRELARLYERGADEAEILAFKQVQAHRVTRLALLDAAHPTEVTPIDAEPGRICYILHNSLPFSSGGYATRSQGIALGLQHAGYDVVTLTRPGFPLDMKPDMDPAGIPADTVIDGLRYVRVLKPLKQGSRVKQSDGGVLTDPYILAAADALTQQFRTLRPSVVMAASNYLTALPALIAARRLDLPFIYEVRGFWEITSMSRNPAYAKTVEYVVEQMMETGLAARADHVFTLTTPMREELVARGVPADNLDLLPNSCDPTRFNPLVRDDALASRLGIPADVPVIGYVGTFVDYEGLEDLAAACARLKGDGIAFRLLLVGNENVSGADMGPIMREILRIAQEAGFQDWLTMPGRVPHEDVERYYSLIDIAPFPRKPWPVCEMVSPMKPLEAMAMTKAVLVSNVRALTEMIQEDHTGLSFEKGNVDSLTERLKQLIASPSLRARLGANGRTWVEQERTWLITGGRAHPPIQRLLAARRDAAATPPWRGGAHAAELAQYRQLLRNAKPTRPLALPEPSRSIYVLHSSLPHLSGGYATRAHGVIAGTRAAGFDVRPYTRPAFPADTHPTRLGKPYPDTDVVDGIPYRRVAAGYNRQTTPELDYMLASIDTYRDVFSRERPAVVHGRSTYLISLPALIAARQLGLPFVYEVSGMWELVFAARDEDGKNQPLIDRVTDLETLIIREADALITLTDDMREELIRRGADPARIHMAPNSVDPDKFTPREPDLALKDELGIPREVPVVGYVGSFVDYEGLDDLVQACALLREQGTPHRLLLVGDGLESKPVRQRIEALGLQDIAILPGRVPHDQVARYYAIIDVLVYARKPWEVCETVSPMKPFEALALEKAVLVSSVRALQAIIEDGQTGRVFEKGNLESLANTLRQLLESPEERARYGRNGRAWVIRNRSWRTVGRTVAQAYEAAIQNHRGQA